jgi:cell division protein FtsB
MLETRTQPNSNRTRRLNAPPRPVARPASAARSVLGNTALETVSAHPLPRTAPAPRTSRLGRSEMRLMGLATTCTAIVCGLLLLYLAAYAHVSQLGYDQAEARTQLRQNQLQNESLRAERDRLQSRRHVIQEALVLGMMPRGETPISYIAARPPRSGRGGREARPSDTLKTAGGLGTDGEQGVNGDTTAGSDKQPSFGH